MGLVRQSLSYGWERFGAGFEAVFDKVFFETIFSRRSVLLPNKLLMGPTRWVFLIRG
jgi:hypothetical protein